MPFSDYNSGIILMIKENVIMRQRIVLQPPRLWTLILLLGLGLFIFALTTLVTPAHAAPHSDKISHQTTSASHAIKKKG